MHRPIVAVSAAILMLALVSGATLAKSKSNIPKERLSKGVYASPAGEFTLKAPERFSKELGMRAEERQTGPTSWGVFFINDFGQIFFVLWSDNDDKKTLEQLTADIQVGGQVRSKEVVDTARGPEVRVAGVLANGSPMVASVERDGKRTDTPMDLVKTSSFFLHGKFFYEVTAGKTRLRDDMTDEVLLADANEMLEGFLSGLTFPDMKASQAP